MTRADVIVIGAGPYGLSAAAHLNTIKGLDVRAFGEPLALWKHQMPKGMFLRSPLSASHIAHPEGTNTLSDFAQERGYHIGKPVSLAHFVEYGDWFQSRVVPQLDRRNIASVATQNGGFHVITADGEEFTSKRVVVAAGPGPCKWRPQDFDNLPASVASHSSDHSDLSRFTNKKVLVVGSGQSALENGALLHEIGADLEMIVRKPSIHWLRWRSRLFSIKAIGRVLYSPRDVGPAGVSQLIARPDLFRRLPRDFQDWATRRSVRPAGALWLYERLRDVKFTVNTFPTKAVLVGDQVRVTLSDGTERLVDHIMFATGFRIDVAKYKFLQPSLIDQLDKVNGYPRLGAGLESSIPGLHFLGAPSGWSFGPLARFVSGTFYSPAALTRHVARREGVK